MATLLIADDAVEDIVLLTKLLEDIAEVMCASDGSSALELAARHHPDLVMLGGSSRDFDGHDICRRLKAHPGTRDIPVIYMNAADADAERGLSAGAIDCIAKPFTPAIVRARVRNQLALAVASEELRAAKDTLRMFKAAVDCSPDGILVTDRDARIEYVNRAFTEITGYEPEEMIGQVPELLRSGVTVDESDRDLWQFIVEGRHWRGEFCNARKDGSLLWQDVSMAPVYSTSGEISHIVAVNSDITPRKQAEEALRTQAITDPLTGVANRRRLLETGAREVERATRARESLSVMIIDVDHFKQVNAALGRSAGDAVLQAIAHLVRHGVRSIDTVARLGGEEFAVVLPITDLAGAYAMAERLRQEVEAQPLQWERHPIPVTVSIGVAEYTSETGIFASLLDRADEALYEAKGSGRNRVTVAKRRPARERETL
jgi:diguanylate cyclase (GGDEF)-like protein/PAS domain S-box-containing protein